METLGMPPSAFYDVAQDWRADLHVMLDLPWPCPAATAFGQLWDHIIADLVAAGARIGLGSYRGWNDGDRDSVEAIWCLVAHLHPNRVVETGVAHGLTSRVVLEGLERNRTGRLWSVDLPAVEPALHAEIGMAVPIKLRSRWTYVAGTTRQKLPQVLADVRDLDLFVHDSLHTSRNTGFELQAAWTLLRPGGVAVVDDIHRNVAFRALIDRAGPQTRRLTARHALGPGLWGLAVKPTP
jgi:predicted O-methyltransferase YrrM